MRKAKIMGKQHKTKTWITCMWAEDICTNTESHCGLCVEGRMIIIKAYPQD